jgi:hypothetical protein
MKRFPILRGNGRGQSESIPWSVVVIVEADAEKEHGQSLDKLASRGGLSWSELGHLFARHFAIEQGMPVRTAYADFENRRWPDPPVDGEQP